MNNNRGNNNRRRGRGNNNNRQQGGQQLNRIDSRARGNAPQMLEKYRKLAHDAHLNGDRVTAEYYLQFADHYFRVIADTRLRQDEQRGRREGFGENAGDGQRDDGDDGSEFSVESDFPSFDQPPQQYARREREDRPDRQDRPERQDRSERQDRNERQERPERQDRAERQDRSDRPERQERQDRRPPREERVEQAQPQEEAAPEGEVAEARDANPYEPPENPFVRPSRNTRGLRPRREDRQRPVSRDGDEADAPPLGLDPASLPPSIAVRGVEPAEPEPAEAVEEVKPRRRARRKPVDEGDAEAIVSVG